MMQENMKTEIIYEDREVLVIRKPAGLAVQSSAVGQIDVVSELKGYLGKQNRAKEKGNSGSVYLGIIHRLDQPVDGLLVFAKNRKTAAELTRQLGQGTLNKEYRALVCGKLPTPEGELVDYILKDKGGTARIVSGREKEFPEAKRAKLFYRILEEKEAQGGWVSLLEIRIETGRFHQIRCQMSHAGYPLLGDRKYGNPASLEMSGQLGIAAVALCANRLKIIHPTLKKEFSWEVNPHFHL